MSLDSDVIVDRRRIRRKLTFWRVTAVLVAIAAIAIVGVVVTPGGRSTLTASGGYITAIAADHIVAQQSSLVGSIGVLFQYPNFTDLLKTVGIQVEEVKSSPLKAAPNGFEPTSPEARAALDALVKDSYAWF